MLVRMRLSSPHTAMPLHVGHVAHGFGATHSSPNHAQNRDHLQERNNHRTLRKPSNEKWLPPAELVVGLV